jgi:[acyl-carrier-protein] S-malonyltransferase
MGAAWSDHPSFELVDQASEVVRRDVRGLLLAADEETLRNTANAQLATFVTSCVILDAAERVGLEPALCAGHSLGEYTALVATGALSYEEGCYLVAERGAAMADAAEHNAGTMVAVLGLDDDTAEMVCALAEGEVWVANYNAPGQVVIAGEKDAIDRATLLAKQRGAKRVLSFPVGGAFHTPLMAPARDRLRKALASVTFHECEPEVIANVDARAHSEGAEFSSLLSAQLTAPVRWRQSLTTLFDAGARTFVELGPGGVLSGLVKRTVPDDGVTAMSVATPGELESLVATIVAAAAPPAPAHPSAERYEIFERMIVSPATGPFRPAEAYAHAAPKLSSDDNGDDPLHVDVGDLIGWAGATEIRSAFSGRLAGLLVLSGERVVHGQPVAWLRAAVSAEETN